MEKQPLVSICIPTFNGEEYLEESLESVRQQTFKNIELIISDDLSQDRTISIVQNFKKTVDFPVHIESHKPAGIGANWNNCIKKSSGEYIKFLFQDDILLPTCVEELIKILLSNEDVALAACKRAIIVEGEVTPNIHKWMNKYGDLQKDLEMEETGYFLLNKHFLKKEKFLKKNKIGEPTTVLFRKSLIKKIGLFREDLIQVLDLEFYYRVLKKNKIIIVNQELAAFRIHPTQATNINRSNISADYQIYYRILYENFFWYLDFNTQKKLLKKYHPIGKLYSYLRH